MASRAAALLGALLLLLPLCAESSCQRCVLKDCNDAAVAFLPDQSCAEVSQFSMLAGFAKNERCRRLVNATFCGSLHLQGQRNENSDCSHKPGAFCADTCQAMLDCLTAPVLNCDLYTDPDGVCTPFNVSALNLDSGGPAAPPAPLDCPDPSAPPREEKVMAAVELGGLANVDRAQYPNMPPIELVWRDVPFSALFPAHCRDHHWGQPSDKGWWSLWVAFTAFHWTFMLLFWLRRHIQPIRARNIWLVLGTNVVAYVTCTMVLHPVMFTTTSTCDMVIIASFFGGVIFASLHHYRAYELLFLYRWAESRLVPSKRDWYWEHRWMLGIKGLVLFHIPWLVPAAAVFTRFWLTYPEMFGSGKTVLDSGRCQWWYMSPAVQEFAKNLSISLEPSTANPNGYVPYSVHYASCRFCWWNDTEQHWISFFGLIPSTLFAVPIYLLRKINDQYFIWRELMLVMVWCLLLVPVVMIVIYPSINLIVGGVRIGPVVDQTIFTFVAIMELVFPLILTFTNLYSNTSPPASSLLSKLTSLRPSQNYRTRDQSRSEGGPSRGGGPSSISGCEPESNADGDDDNDDVLEDLDEEPAAAQAATRTVTTTARSAASPKQGTPDRSSARAPKAAFGGGTVSAHVSSDLSPPALFRQLSAERAQQMQQQQQQVIAAPTTSASPAGPQAARPLPAAAAAVAAGSVAVTVADPSTAAAVSAASAAPAAGAGAGAGATQAAAPSQQPQRRRRRARKLLLTELPSVGPTPTDVTQQWALPNLTIGSLLADESGLQLAQKCAIEMFCVENVLFYVAARNYRISFRTWTREQAWSEAMHIYEDFVALNAHNEINVSHQLRAEVTAKLVPPSGMSVSAHRERTRLLATDFDRLLQEVKTLLKNNILPRFKKSKFYHQLITQLVARKAFAVATVRADDPERKLLLAAPGSARGNGSGHGNGHIAGAGLGAAAPPGPVRGFLQESQPQQQAPQVAVSLPGVVTDAASASASAPAAAAGALAPADSVELVSVAEGKTLPAGASRSSVRLPKLPPRSSSAAAAPSAAAVTASADAGAGTAGAASVGIQAAAS